MADQKPNWIYPDRHELKDGPAQIKRYPDSEWKDVVLCSGGRMFEPRPLPNGVFMDQVNVMFAYSIRVRPEAEQAPDERVERDLRSPELIEYFRQKNERLLNEFRQRSFGWPFLAGMQASADN